VTLVDHDLLAIRYSNQNILKNNLSNATAVSSVGMETLEDNDFDLIVSNVPAKIRDDAIAEEFIISPYNHPTQNGEIWIVVINALNRLIPKVASRHNLHLQEIRNRKSHTVYRITESSC